MLSLLDALVVVLNLFLRGLLGPYDVLAWLENVLDLEPDALSLKA